VGALLVLEDEVVFHVFASTSANVVREASSRADARRARVTYAVHASDAVDGTVPVSCRPRSGSRFRIGRTVVRCSATDSSGNTATARFTVRVKRRR
jgi:hypothetical protein